MQAKGSEPSRRTRVAGHRGIYYRVGADGKRRYEISYVDASGTRRWKVTGYVLKDAIAVRAALEATPRPERTPPARITLEELAERYFEHKTANLKPKTIERYKLALDGHVLPRLGRVRITELSVDHVARLAKELQAAGYRPWTIRGDLVALSRVLAYAERSGWIAANPVRKLDASERPRVARATQRVLERDEMTTLLEHAGSIYRPLIAVGLFAGLRVSEALGLTWGDIDLDGSRLRVRYQLGRDGGKAGGRVATKTDQAVRDVVLMPTLAKLLAEHKLATRHNGPTDYVFAGATGEPLNHRTVSRAFERVAKAAGLDADGKERPTFHDLRHSFASMLIAGGADVVFLSRQLGHANPAITLSIYAHAFAQRDHGDRLMAQLEAGYGSVLGTAMERENRQERAEAATDEPTRVVDMQVFRS